MGPLWLWTGAGSVTTFCPAWWLVETRGTSGEHRAYVLPLGVSNDGKRAAGLEQLGVDLFGRAVKRNETLELSSRLELLHTSIEPMIDRDLQHRGIVPAGGSYAAKLIGWVEVS